MVPSATTFVRYTNVPNDTDRFVPSQSNNVCYYGAVDALERDPEANVIRQRIINEKCYLLASIH